MGNYLCIHFFKGVSGLHILSEIFVISASEPFNCNNVIYHPNMLGWTFTCSDDYLWYKVSNDCRYMCLIVL